MRRLNQRVAKESLARSGPEFVFRRAKPYEYSTADRPRSQRARVAGFRHRRTSAGKIRSGNRPSNRPGTHRLSTAQNYNLHPEDQPDLRIDMSTSVLDLKTRILSSKARTTIQRADFNIAGDSVEFDTNSKTGRLIGNIKMVITDKSHLTAKPSPKNEKFSGAGFDCMRDRRARTRAGCRCACRLPLPTKAEKPAKAKTKNKDKKKDDKSSGTNLFGPGAAGEQSNGPTTTQIYSDEAFFDSTKNVGIF